MMLGIRTVIGQLSKPGVQFKEKLDTLDFTEESTLVRVLYVFPVNNQCSHSYFRLVISVCLKRVRT